MLAGEVLTHFSCENLHLLPVSSREPEVGSTEVSVRITNYRIIISSAVASRPPVDIPLSNIKDLERTKFWVDITTKHVWAFRLFSKHENVVYELATHLEEKIPRKLMQLFCFTHHEANKGGAEDSGWGIFNIETELRRQTALDDCAEPGMGTNLQPWFHIIPLQGDQFATYPLAIVAPRRATTQLINAAARFRQNGRVPSISWIDLDTGGCIARCSQPLVGSHMRNSDDEMLLSYLNQSLHANAVGLDPPQTPQTQTRGMASSPAPMRGPPPSLFVDDESEGEATPQEASIMGPKTDSESGGKSLQLECEGRKLHVFDCRSKASAAANLANGGGFEMVQNYDRCKIHFLGIDNLHAVRSSFERLSKVLTNERPRPGQDMSMGKIEQTGWPAFVQKVIMSSDRCAALVSAGDSVLVHCTDGWDRTPEIVTLAMLMKDTYYRTIEGFCQLVEREWLQMGHRFADRCGHCLESDDFVVVSDAQDENEAAAPKDHTKAHYSMIFVQWLDCVYQLLRMFPTEFEFTPHFLIVLGDFVYSCRFGTFLYNCHRSRCRRGGVITSTASAWTEIQRMMKHEMSEAGHSIAAGERLVNPFFNARRRRNEKHTSRRLIPSFHTRKYTFFAAWFQRYDCNLFPGEGCHAQGVIGLEPDDLTPLIETFISHPSYIQSMVSAGQDRAFGPDAMWSSRVPLSALVDDWRSRRDSPPPESLSAMAQALSETQYKKRADSKSCDICGTAFTFLNRRHTCRRCSCSCCGPCGNKFVVLPKSEISLFEDRDSVGPVRVCTKCYSAWIKIHPDSQVA